MTGFFSCRKIQLPPLQNVAIHPRPPTAAIAGVVIGSRMQLLVTQVVERGIDRDG